MAPRKRQSSRDGVVRAAIYARISDDREGEALGVKRQRSECESLCRTKGWQVAHYFEDNDISAWDRSRTRPGWEQLLQAIEDGSVDAIVAVRADRLLRQPRDLERLIDTCTEAGVTQVETVDGALDLTTPQGELTARLLAALAKQESDIKSARIRSKALQLAEQGKVGGGGTRPYGFKSDRKTHEPKEARIVRNLAKRFIAGESLYSLVAWLNEQGHTTTTGGPWQTQVLRRLLLSPRIAGLRQHRGPENVIATAEWKGIISVEQHQSIAAILNDPSRALTREPLKYLLTGLLLCTCGGSMVSHRHRNQPRYICRRSPGKVNCGKRAMLAEPLEALVVRATLTRLQGLESTSPDEAATDEATAALVAERDDVNQRLRLIMREFTDGNLTHEEWREGREALTRRAATIDARVKALNKPSRAATLADAKDIDTRWESLPISRQRSILKALIDKIVISPALHGRNRFDADRIDIVWSA